MMTLSRWKIIAVLASAIFGLLFSLPNLLPAQTLAALPAWMPHQKLNLGLDLQGGSYLLLEVDTNALRAERLGQSGRRGRHDAAQRQHRHHRPVAGQRTRSGSGHRRRSRQRRRRPVAQECRRAPGRRRRRPRRDRQQRRPDQRSRSPSSPKAQAADAAKAVDQSIEIIRRRIDSLGTKEPTIVRQGANRIVVQAPGESDPEKLRNIIGQTAKLTFQMVDETVSPEDIAAGRIPPSSELLPHDDGFAPSYLLDRRALVTGEMLTDAQQAFDPQTGQPVVTFRFNGVGARRFGDATGKNIGRRFAIVLDNKVISAPTIQSAITGGSGVITGNFTPETANNLALLLRSGALPAPLTVEDQRTVTAELGADAVKAGLISTVVGFVAILIFMILAYGFLFGGISVIALAINGLLIVAIMSLTQATLTLPGYRGPDPDPGRGGRRQRADL